LTTRPPVAEIDPVAGFPCARPGRAQQDAEIGHSAGGADDRHTAITLDQGCGMAGVAVGHRAAVAQIDCVIATDLGPDDPPGVDYPVGRRVGREGVDALSLDVAAGGDDQRRRRRMDAIAQGVEADESRGGHVASPGGSPAVGEGA